MPLPHGAFQLQQAVLRRRRAVNGLAPFVDPLRFVRPDEHPHHPVVRARDQLPVLGIAELASVESLRDPKQRARLSSQVALGLKRFPAREPGFLTRGQGRHSLGSCCQYLRCSHNHSGLELLGPFSGLVWFAVVAFVGWKAFLLWTNFPTIGMRSEARQHARTQGRLSDGEVMRRFRSGGTTARVGGVKVVTGMIPLGYLSGKPIGIPWTADAGHIAVVGPTRSGKGLHLTDTLIRWPGPVVCVDPKGEQWERTAGSDSRRTALCSASRRRP